MREVAPRPARGGGSPSRRELVVGALAATGCGLLRPPRKGPPNLVLILTDDQGYNDVGCYWSADQDHDYARIETPRLDQMAKEGTRFTDFYVAASTCSPSRAAILTGRYPPRCGFIEDTNLGPGDRAGLPSKELTIAELLKPLGYATACVGKWHVGAPAGMRPNDQGFDLFYGVPWSSNQHPLPLMRNTETLEQLPNKPILVEDFTREACEFVAANRDRPFFLYLAHTAPHAPLSIEPEYAGKSARGLYGDVVMRIDWSVGAVLDAIRAQGLDDDTLVVFTSDNGPWVNKGYLSGDATPFRGGKGATLEGGMREPMIARWPGRVRADAVVHELCSALDFLPTFVRLAGGSPPPDVILDGHDLWPLLTDPAAKSAYDAFFYFAQGRLEAVRRDRWKLRLEVPERLPLEVHQALYDLPNDPREETDVSAAHPEIVADLFSRATAIELELGLAPRPNEPILPLESPGP